MIFKTLQFFGHLQTDSCSHQFIPRLSGVIIRLSILRRHCRISDQSIELRLAGRDTTLRTVFRASWSVGMQIGHFALRQSLRRGPRHQHLAERHQRRG